MATRVRRVRRRVPPRRVALPTSGGAFGSALIANVDIVFTVNGDAQFVPLAMDAAADIVFTQTASLTTAPTTGLQAFMQAIFTMNSNLTIAPAANGLTQEEIDFRRLLSRKVWNRKRAMQRGLRLRRGPS